MLIDIQPALYTRCDLIAFSARNFAGKRSILRSFPGGNTKGKIHTAELSSLIIRAPIGTRVILATYGGESWEKRSWRCINVLKGHCLLPEESGFPGVRIPDLDLMNSHGAKKIDPNFQSSYPLVDTVTEGEGWTFGHILNKKLKGNIQQIIIEKINQENSEEISPAQRLARALLTYAKANTPGHFSKLEQLSLQNLEKRTEQTQLVEWLKTLN